MNYTKLTEREAYRYQNSLAKYLPYLDILDNYVIKKNGNFVAGFEIDALDNMGLSNGDYDLLSATIENALNGLDEKVNLQFFYTFDYYPYQADYIHLSGSLQTWEYEHILQRIAER